MVKNRGLLVLVVILPLTVLSLLLLLAAWTVQRAAGSAGAEPITMPATEPADAAFWEGAGSSAPLQPGADSTDRFPGEATPPAPMDYRVSDLASDQTPQGSVTFLVIGRHGENTDTLILGRLDPQERRMAVLSIPRDLYVGGQRINRIYAEQGIEALTERIAWITGTPVDHYLDTDMLAFVDAIDLLGGIEVDVEEPLHDPTYAAFEGRDTTLWLAPGHHRLDGLDALRYVRSRQTTSDFDRARRQQQVLRALTERATELTFRDLTTIARVSATAMRYVETDLALGELLYYLRMLRHVETVRGTVLNTDNVLRATYTAAYGTAASADQLPPEQRGAWVLVPKSDDWGVIRKYAEGFFRRNGVAAGS
jgi:LCP family protein required for cell wall assembly